MVVYIGSGFGRATGLVRRGPVNHARKGRTKLRQDQSEVKD